MGGSGSKAKGVWPFSGGGAGGDASSDGNEQSVARMRGSRTATPFVFTRRRWVTPARRADLSGLTPWLGILPQTLIQPSPLLISSLKRNIKPRRVLAGSTQCFQQKRRGRRREERLRNCSAHADQIPCADVQFLCSCRLASSLYYDEDGDLAHEFYEETVVTKNGRKKSKLKRIQKNLIPQVRDGLCDGCVRGGQPLNVCFAHQGIVKLEHPCIHVDFPMILCEV